MTKLKKQRKDYEKKRNINKNTITKSGELAQPYPESKKTRPKKKYENTKS